MTLFPLSLRDNFKYTVIAHIFIINKYYYLTIFKDLETNKVICKFVVIPAIAPYTSIKPYNPIYIGTK